MSLQDSTSDNLLDPTIDEHDTSSDKGGTSSATDKTETRLDIMKSWIKTCDERHGQPCIIPKEDASIWPMWVVDVVDGCIVRGDIADRYLTLSYVWGGVQTLQATTANIEQLRQPGILTRDEFILPKTIQQALDVTRLLGERYIWIDQLSILQDDVEHKQVQIEHMAEIYASSYLTLIAVTGGTADYGLNDDFDRIINHIPGKMAHDGFDPLVLFYYTNESSVWSRRGWTFQENLFARRVICFSSSVSDDSFGSMLEIPETISWECQYNWCWDVYGSVMKGVDQCLDRCPGRQQSLNHQTTLPQFSKYLMLTGFYASREFTCDSDVISAFTGTASLLAKTFLGGVFHGLPLLFFDIALLWSFGETSSARRVDAIFDESKRPPSWSWMTWRGQMQYTPDSFCSWQMTAPPDPRNGISPLVQWYFFGPGGARVAIKSDYHKYKHFAQDGESIPPSGWSRVMPSSANSDRCENHVYVTSSAPREEFRFPIPLVDPSSPEIPIPKPISNRITCQTERAHFYLSGLRKHSFRRPYHLLLDSQHCYSGVMNRFDHLLGPCSEMVDKKDTITVELIAISTGSISESIDEYIQAFGEYDCSEHQNVGGIYEFYNVLCIEWADGIAYRKSVGRVVKAAWEAADRELIDVILG